MISLNPIALFSIYYTDAGAGTVSATKSSSKFASSFLGILKSSRRQAEDDALTRTWHSSSDVKSILRESSFHSIPSPPQPKPKAKEQPQSQSDAGSTKTNTNSSSSSSVLLPPYTTDQGKYLRLFHCNIMLNVDYV